MEQRLQVSFEKKDDFFSVRQFAVHEGISQLFRVELIALCDNAAVDLEGITGKAARFEIKSGLLNASTQNRMWSGICRDITLLRPENKGASTYRIVIVPHLWLLTQRTGNRVYQHETIPDILTKLLGEWKIEFKSDYEADYDKLEYVVQYGETDLAFVMRLMERAGISFFYQFVEGTLVLVLSDHPQDNPARAGAPIHYTDNPSEAAQQDFVSKVTLMHQVRPGVVTYRDFDFRGKLDRELIGTAVTVNSSETFYEQYVYEPGGFLEETGLGARLPHADDKGHARNDDDVGQARAERTLRSFRQKKRVVSFWTNCIDLTAGVVFSIAQHPRRDLSLTPLLITDFVLRGTTNGQWTFEGDAVFADLPFQPEYRTEKPRILGVQSAMVVGSSSEEIHTDEFGRVRVQFHWDREGQFSDKSSCWIRVSQTWAGAGFGMFMLPRVGQEVIVGFLEGDPDQPMVVGRVYNATTKVPYALPKHKTRSTWKSDSSPSSRGFNEIMFEDMKGAELFYVQAQKDLQKLVKDQETDRVGGNKMTIVGNDRREIIATLDSTVVGDRQLIEMVEPPPDPDEDLKIFKQGKPEVSSLPTKIQMNDQGLIFTTGEASVVLYKGDIWFEASGDISFKAKGADHIIEAKPVLINTQAPPTAPVADDAEPMEPGTYGGEWTDQEYRLKKKGKTLETPAPTVQTPPPVVAPPAPPAPPPTETVVCELLGATINCGHNGRQPDLKTHVLEVVPDATGDKLDLAANVKANCGQHAEWRISGAASGTENGTKANYTVHHWAITMPGVIGMVQTIRADPKKYRVSASACSGTTKAWMIHAYPHGDDIVSLDFGSLRDIFERVKRISQKLRLDAVPKLLVGKASGSAGWREHSDHRAYCEVKIDVGFNPVLGWEKEFRVPVMPAPLEFAARFMEAWDMGTFGVFVRFSAAINANGTFGGKLGIGAVFGSVNIAGSIGVALLIKAELKDSIKVEANLSGECGIECPLTAEGSKGRFEIYTTPKIFMGRVKGAVSLTITLGRIPFTKRHLEVEVAKEVTIFEGFPIYESQSPLKVWPGNVG